MSSDSVDSILTLDSSQVRALEACAGGTRVSVLGAPGTGKTTVLAELVLREVRSGGTQPPRIAVITQDRRAASELRGLISRMLGGITTGVSVQTLTAFAFTVAQSYAQAVGRKNPELIAGPDEDSLVAAILSDVDAGFEFPTYVTEDVRLMPAFRAQIRDLLTRAQELGYSPEQLEALGRDKNEPMWVAGGQVLRVYEELTEAQDAFAGSAQAPDRLDHAQLITAAASMLAGWEDFVSSSQPNPTSIPRPQWDWVIVDDVQNAPHSIIALLRELAATGASIVVAGDPDSAVQGFRGGIASLPGDVQRPEPEGLACVPVYLQHRHRFGGVLARTADTLVEHIRVGGAVALHRMPEGSMESSVRGQRYVHSEEQAAGIARTVRELHVTRSVPYSQIAVITRSRSEHAALRSSLVRRLVPVEQVGSDVPLRDRPAVKALLETVELALGIPGADGIPSLAAVLRSPIIGIDALSLIRHGRILRAFELANGGERHEKQLLELILTGPDALEQLVPSGVPELVRAASIIQRVRDAASRTARQAEQVLWAAWEACGRAEVWREAAIKGGVAGDAADDSLDSVIQLFRAVQRMADRDPEVTIDVFLREIAAQDLPEDSIARAGALTDAISLTTPAASQGREWDYVVVAGLQDGSWPNLRLRDSYTHTTRLAQIATGREVSGISPADERSEAFEDVLDDELRQLHHAITRARKSLLVTCVDSEGNTPSRFFQAMGFREEGNEHSIASEGGSDATSATSPILASAGPLKPDLDATSLIGQIRRAAAYGELEGDQREAANHAWSVLHEAGFDECEPSNWIDALPPSVQESSQRVVEVSPSRVEGLLQCPLRGTLGMLGAERSDQRQAASIGTLIHAVAEEFPHGPEALMKASFDRRWRASQPLAPEDSELAAEAYQNGLRMVEALAAYAASHPEDVEVEKRVRAEVDPHTFLNASLDRVSSTSDGLRVADFKTSKVLVNKQKAPDHIQLQLYQWALRQVAPDSPSQGAELVYVAVRDTKGYPTLREQAPLDADSSQRAVRRIRSAADLLRRDQLPAQPDEGICRNCQFAIVCPAMSAGRMFS
ncbi:ATP-dependent helicase [Changpingibacter yushuensis]|uniref:ATP-dependent helicase n=1 Tax=Changpingibacter yushuensis TaxID=2758440 RepID=UPI00165DC05F|nr:ATP-dependent DNA helicase [Changpingibacter yushuensis]